MAEELIQGNLNNFANRHPIKNATAVDRAATAGFQRAPEHIRHQLRSRTGHFDNIITSLRQGRAMCMAAGQVVNSQGRTVARYRGYTVWASRRALPGRPGIAPVERRIREFIHQIELRELAIADGIY